ncbi:hypothetical protein RHSIM_Rhsim02G0062900 [Rhododendron simsii]|uniref:Protein kinase domain-containing protein n=1 Tax=Rhododendron simsii TaxID=118357 RepID=A0A834HEF3_RHOSS|nr:hypothetical protein RHSIM_Rhsim02G0062900 [Rhododendron simsii]
MLNSFGWFGAADEASSSPPVICRSGFDQWVHPLCHATKDFDDALVVGTGGFGKVYKGIIDDGATTTVVAIKRLNAESTQGAEEFWTEVKLLSKLRHTHLVSLIGYCNEWQEMILVYEYIARGTLANLLYKASREESDTRLEEEQISLILWAKMYIRKGKLDRVIDPSLNGDTTPHSLKRFAELAYKCLHTQPKERPTTSDVVESLEIALVSHERKGRSQGTITKAFQGIKLVPKGMNRWWRAGKGSGSNGLITHCPRFSLAEIHAATNDFNEGLLISQDGFFSLYEGCMVGGTIVVAIKRFESKTARSLQQFSAEIQVQSLTRHPNIVTLIGFCDEKHELILVYEYLVNGTLESHLHETENDPIFWKKRIEICIDIARGLEYLHTNVEQQVIHRDIKPSNIFLDDKWVAKVAAFEHSIPIKASIATEGFETGVCGTLGYIDPKSFFFGKFTRKADVYSFGVVLLEVLCAKKPCIREPNTGENSLLPWFHGCIKSGTIDTVIDPYLIGKIAPECFRHYVYTALSCLVKGSIRRPSMDDVLCSLQSSLQLQEAWENSIEMGDELSIADVPDSYNNVISVESEFIIGEQSLLISDFVQ